MQFDRLLVTGGAGFIGANFVHYWMARHPEHRVVVLDALTYAGNPANLHGVRDWPGFRFVHGNILDEVLVETLLREEALNCIVHFAAESHVDRSILGPDIFLTTNVMGTHNLLKVAKKVWLDAGMVTAHRFHHVSTDEVYGSLALADAAFTESTPYQPTSPYAASKAASDHLVRTYGHTYGLDISISNCSNNYGPLHYPEKLIPLMIVNILQGLPLPIYGQGSNVRDWLHVEDHCRGIELILERGKSGETYNIGAHGEMTNINLVGAICDAFPGRFQQQPDLARRFPRCPASQGRNPRELMKFVQDRPGHDLRYAINATKIRSALGFAPAYSFAKGIQVTIDWYLEHEAWWRALMGGEYHDWIDRQYQAPATDP